MSFEEPQHRHAPRVAAYPLADGGGDSQRPTPRRDSEKAWAALEAFAERGVGKESDLPALMTRLAWDDGALRLLPQIATRVSGDTVLACAEVLEQSPAAALPLALGAAPPPTSRGLKRYLGAQSAQALLKLEAEPDLVPKLRAALPGPMVLALPALAKLPDGMHDQRQMMAWYVETTSPAIAALTIAQRASPALAATLDELDAWAWIDHLHVAALTSVGEGIATLRDATKHPTAQARLTALARSYGPDASDAERAHARMEAEAQLDKNDDEALLDAAARTQAGLSSSHVSPKKLGARLANEPADLVFEFLYAAGQIEISEGIALLSRARGVRAEHVVVYLRAEPQDGVIHALRSDATRRRIRKLLGPAISLRELFDSEVLPQVHPQIVRDEALRQWVYEDGDPRSLLWLAAGSAEGAKDGCRIVRAERGNGWVEQLTGAADDAQLRRFALHSKDARAVKLVRERLLRDAPHRTEADANDVVAIDGATYGAGARARLDVAAAPAYADPAEVLARLADLTPAERAALLQEPRALARLLDDVSREDLVRAVALLGPTLPQLLALPIAGPQPLLVGYAAARPDAEALAALRQPPLVAAARRVLGPHSPLVVFASLRDPRALAAALAGNGPLLEWILETTEPSDALALLGREPARAAAADLLETRATPYADLPEYDLLRPDAQQAFDAIDRRVADADTREANAAYRDGEADDVDRGASRRARALEDARDEAALAPALAALDRRGGGAAEMLSLVRAAPPAQVLALLDGTHRAEVDLLRRTTGLMPPQVFPALSTATLLELPGTATWLLDREAPSTLLALLAASPPAQRALVNRLETGATGPDWTERLPRGAGLLPQERQTLDALCKHARTAEVARALFAVRFDVTVQGFDLAEIRRLWGIAARLPPAQLDQRAVRAIVETDIAPLGQWSSPDIELDDTADRFTGTDQTYNAGQQLTAADVRRLYGLTDQELALAAGKGGWLRESGGRYTVAPIDIDQLTSTVLHEIGHSIDTLLGEQTELVFGLGGWRELGLDQIEAWAADTNALDGIAATDRPLVLEAWRHALRAQIPVGELVGPDHPARAERYAASPLVAAARRGSTLHYAERDKPTTGPRVGFQNAGRLFSIPVDTYLSAPSSYALHAPAEFFAECYVEYYRQYDGTPATAAKKGGRLAPWIKQWFDAHVDRIRLSPSRVRAAD